MSRPSLAVARARAAACVAACAGLLGLSGPAAAFVRYRTSTGNPYSWRTTSVSLTGYPHGLPNMPLDQITSAMTASVGAWSREDPTNALCSYLELALSFAPETAVPPDAVHDDMNTIAIRDGNWEGICSTTPAGRTECHQPGELALTTVWSRSCGEIVEADVEINAESSGPFRWADLDAATANGQQDLQNALTHEMGHFIGLDHTCVLNGAYPLDKSGQPIIPVDNLGNPVLDCSDPQVTSAEMEATMYPSADPGDLTKRSLSPDDHAGLCAIYQAGTNPQSCGGGQASGCSMAAAPADGGDHFAGARWGWVLGGAVTSLAAAIASRVRRQRRRGPSSPLRSSSILRLRTDGSPSAPPAGTTTGTSDGA